MAFVLASTSPIRLQLLRSVGLTVEAVAPRVDEETTRLALVTEGARPRDIADALAEAKARKVADRRPGDLVLGCDQVLEFEGAIFAKPESPAAGKVAPAFVGRRRVRAVRTCLEPCRRGPADDASDLGFLLG